MSEQFSILIDSRSRFETGAPGGAWLSMPATQEQLHAAMRSVGITADNPQDFFVGGFANTEDCPFDVPLAVIQSGSMDELNYLGKLLEMQRDEDKAKFAAAVTLGEYAGNLKDLINLAQNLDCYWLYPTVQSEEDYGYYLIDELDELELPEEAKKYFMYEEYGRDAAINDGGRFTEQGYVYNNKNTFSEWYNGRDIPKEYRIMSYPQPTRLDPEKVEMDAAAMQAAPLTVEPPQPQPVIPINLTAEKPAEKLKEITDRLEQGITELFDSERYKEYLRVMSKFHNYSFNNTLLIAMQKPDASLIAGFTAWKNQFQRNVKKGEKGIKIIAPSPFKIKQETEKIDPQTQKPVIGRDGKPVTEEKEITIPAYKVVSVFDVSQTEGKELPDIAVDALTGDVEQYSDFFAALEKTSPVPIGFEKIEGGAHGYYHLEDKRIALDEGMSELQTLKTAIHEIAHAKLHDIDLNAPKDEQQPRVDRRTREVEAESVAYTVCQHYGLDTSDYSFGYVAGWSSGRELAELKSSLETIRSAAADIINSIDGHIAELQKQREAEKAAPDLAAAQEEQSEKAAPPLTDLQKKAAAIAEKYEALSTQEKIGVIAQSFGGTAGRIETSPCTGKWRGTSDISIRFDNGASLFLGNRLTPKAKTAAVQRELVNAALLRYNPEIVSAAKETALTSLMEREAKDNAIAAQKGLKPYTLLNVEFNDGADSQSSGYMGWYYVTLAVDGKICSHIETGLNYDIADGKVSAEPTREKYFAAGALKDSEVDYVFNNVGFSSASGLYALPVSDAVLQRAEKTLAERTQAQAAQRTEKDVIYTMHTNPRSESLADRSFLQAYEQQPDGKAIPGDLLFVGTPEKCRELLQSLNAGDLTQGEVKALYAKAQEPDRDTFSIYQLKRGDETRDLRFEPYDRLTATGHAVDPANYDLIYSAPLAPGTSLEDIFTRFNLDHPKDFKGHSLSVSDVVVLHQNGQDTAHYVDSIGYRQTPEFLQPQNYLKHVEDIVEQNDNNFDGIINNMPQTPTVGELEQKAKAGEPISLIDLTNAIHADKERGKEEKPSIRAQLRAAKEQTAQRKAQRSKTQDLERN